MVPIHFIIMSVQLLNLVQKTISFRGLWFINIYTVSSSINIINDKAYMTSYESKATSIFYTSFTHHCGLLESYVLNRFCQPPHQLWVLECIREGPFPRLWKVSQAAASFFLAPSSEWCALSYWAVIHRQRKRLLALFSQRLPIGHFFLLRSETSCTTIDCKPAEQTAGYFIYEAVWTSANLTIANQ